MLLLTDRPKDGLRLRQILGAVEPCVLLAPGQAATRSTEHGLIVCDVSPADPAATVALQAVLSHHRGGLAVPLLHLARGEQPGAAALADVIGATVVLPRGASDAQILFTARQMLAPRRAAPRRPAFDIAMGASAREASAAFGDLFDAARGGRPLSAANLQQGGDAVIASVGQGRIGAWLDMVRNYDDITYQHCLLVAGLAAGFAARLGMTLKGQRLIAQAALIHDIGKANIPLAILNKGGRLSAPEMDAMRAHASIGHELLVRQGGFDPQLLDVVRHHHEYLDGTGYPDALHGEAVSALVRLVTICDIYAALIERRPYKPPLPSAEALAILAAMGRKLDEGLLRAFRELVGDG